jgi:hypothetical protein
MPHAVFCTCKAWFLPVSSFSPWSRQSSPHYGIRRFGSQCDLRTFANVADPRICPGLPLLRPGEGQVSVRDGFRIYKSPFSASLMLQPAARRTSGIPRR